VFDVQIQLVALSAIRQVSNVEDFLKRDIVFGATNGLGLFPKLAEMSRTTAKRSMKFLHVSIHANYLSHSIVTMR
jgi:hypothetical protein